MSDTEIILDLQRRIEKLEAQERWRQIRGQPHSPMARAYEKGKYDPDKGPYEPREVTS